VDFSQSQKFGEKSRLEASASSHKKQITDSDFERLDAAAFKLENGLKRQIETLQNKRLTRTWDDSFVIRETNEVYEIKDAPPD
jgi:hypothetical protein